jgi:hypothetical protein
MASALENTRKNNANSLIKKDVGHTTRDTCASQVPAYRQAASYTMKFAGTTIGDRLDRRRDHLPITAKTPVMLACSKSMAKRKHGNGHSSRGEDQSMKHHFQSGNHRSEFR